MVEKDVCVLFLENMKINLEGDLRSVVLKSK